MRTLYVLVGIIWCVGVGLYIGAVEYPQELESSIGAMNGWLEPRTGFAMDKTPKRVAGELIVAMSALFSLLRLTRKAITSARKDTASCADLAKTVADLERDVHRVEAEAAAQKSIMEKVRALHEKLDALRGSTSTANHNSPTSPGYSHKTCVHGKCLNHEPEWEDVGEKRHEPNSPPKILSRILFGETRWFTTRCCGKPLARMKQVQTQKCKKCGGQQDLIESYNIALCHCCGRRYNNTSFTC